MRWDFFLFFTSLVMTYFGEVGLYIGLAGMTASAIHGFLKMIRNPGRLRMIVIAGMVITGTGFLSFSAFHFKPGWFGLAQAPGIAKDSGTDPTKRTGPNVMGPVTGNKGIVTQDQKGNNQQ
jgi:hypothetical protein